MGFVLIQLKYVHCEETNVSDWSKLDGTVAKMSKTFSYAPSMFGTFDFDNLPDDTQATQKQRKTRRKAEPAEEKRPTSLQESSSTNSGTAKVEAVFNIIKEVSLQMSNYFEKNFVGNNSSNNFMMYSTKIGLCKEWWKANSVLPAHYRSYQHDVYLRQLLPNFVLIP